MRIEQSSATTGINMNVKLYRTVLNTQRRLELQELGNVCVCEDSALTGSETIVSILQELGLTNAADEYFYVFCLNIKNDLIGIFEVSHGGNFTSVVPIREIFQKTLLTGAVNIIVAHNHPSGHVNPSEEDKAVTKRIIEAGNLLDIALLDHIIVGPNSDYFSFCDAGLMD